MKKEISKQAMDAAKEYIGERIALALWVSPQEKEGLRAMGYDPDKLICIERFNDETVFLPVQYGYPISLAKKDGGGRKDCHTPVIVAHCLVMVVYRCPLRQVLPPRSTVITLTKNRISASNHQASNQPFDHIDTIPCSRSCSLLLH